MEVSIYELATLNIGQGFEGLAYFYSVALIFGLLSAGLAQMLPARHMRKLSLAVLVGLLIVFAECGYTGWRYSDGGWDTKLVAEMIVYIVGVVAMSWCFIAEFSAWEGRDRGRLRRLALSLLAAVTFIGLPVSIISAEQSSNNEHWMRLSKDVNHLFKLVETTYGDQPISEDDILNVPKKVQWFSKDNVAVLRQRALMRIISFGIPNALFRMRHPDAFAIDNATNWRIAKVEPDLKLRSAHDGEYPLPSIYCFYDHGKLAHTSLLLPSIGSDDIGQFDSEPLQRLRDFCPSIFNPGKEPLTSPMIKVRPPAKELHPDSATAGVSKVISNGRKRAAL